MRSVRNNAVLSDLVRRLRVFEHPIRSRTASFGCSKLRRAPSRYLELESSIATSAVIFDSRTTSLGFVSSSFAPRELYEDGRFAQPPLLSSVISIGSSVIESDDDRE